ncbi:uncharacterized protein LOC132703189 [Cylas formicarius]|uniref:uncharacterized protein LOC132703189 n=1 Tax=Cylas formicarius TaxID=197179 RepID=UPI00295883C8|nr:uncharacterized protein LOC132703189 [Cylas formicarius]
MGPTNLAQISKQEVVDFVKSFDYVFCDIDGVLLLGGTVIPGSNAFISKLRKLKKRIVCVTNNTVFSANVLEKFLVPFDVPKADVVNPSRAILEYLKKINFNKSLYVIGTNAFKNSLRNAGFNLIEFKPDKLDEFMGVLRTEVKNVEETEADIGAVIVDMDINFSLVKAERAVILLTTRNDILFLSGMSDHSIPFPNKINVLGSKFYIDAIEDITKRQSIKFAKPSLQLKNILNEDFGVTDSGRVLFIGDSIDSDMGFASNCGYQKLLVLTGNANEDDIKNWNFPEEYKPKYFVHSLNDFSELLSRYNIFGAFDMTRLKDLELVTKEDLTGFINSVQYVCFDIDGVLLLAGKCIPGAQECIARLRKLDKKIIFASNNSVAFVATLKSRLSEFNAVEDEIVTPNEALIDYLQDINFLGDIYVIGGRATKIELKKVGYNVIEFETETIEESLIELRAECVQAYERAQEIGAVVLDFDLNFNLLKAQRAITLLNANKDILLFSGARDDIGPLSKELIALGPKFYIETIERVTKRSSIDFAKPSMLLKDVIQDKYDIDDPKKVLFVGDSTLTDVAFANQSGFQSLLVLSGTTKADEVANWNFPDDHKPHYYVTSLKELSEVLEKHNVE